MKREKRNRLSTKIAEQERQRPATIGFRISPELRKRLERSALARGRSLSQEAAFRLEQSFMKQDLLADVLTLAYGAEEAGLGLLLLRVMQEAGSNAIGYFSRDWDERLREWHEVPGAVAEAAEAAKAVLDCWAETAKNRPNVNRAHANAAEAVFNVLHYWLEEVVDPESERIEDLLGESRARLQPLSDLHQKPGPSPQEIREAHALRDAKARSARPKK
jgi:hypothetical protein